MAQSRTATKRATSPKKSAFRQEVRLLRSLAISIVGQDAEGTYRPAFVKDILKAASEKATNRYTSKGDLL